MKRFRTVLSVLMVAVLLAGFMLVPGGAVAGKALQPGDINGDGKVNVGDVSRLYSHVRGVRLITDEDALRRADVTGDGKLNIGDTAGVYSMIRTTMPNKTNVTLKVWMPEEDLYYEGSWLLQMEKSFEQAHPEYNITWINESCSEGDVQYALSSDPANAADVYMFAHDQLDWLRQEDMVTALEGKYLEQVLSDNSQTVINTVTGADDQVYGFPVANNTWFMYYNKSVFSPEDVKSLDTMLTKGRIAFPWGSSWYSGTFFLANGGQIFGDKGNDFSAGIQFGADNGGYEAALKMVQLAAHPNFVEDINGLGWSGMRDGSISAFFSGWWDYQGLKEALGDDLGVVQLPTVEIDGQQKQMMSFAGSKAVGVNPDADDQTAAMEFAAHLASVEGQKLRYQLRGVVPAAKALVNDPEIQADPLAVAEISTMNNAAVVQSHILEMNNYWIPVGNFGSMIANGFITEDNYQEQVDLMMYELNNFGIYEPEDPEIPEEPDLPELPEGSDVLLPLPEDGTPITLKVWTAPEDQMEDRNWLVRMENNFQQAHPEYSITWVNEACYEGDVGDVASADPADAADVYMFANDQLEKLQNAGALSMLQGQYLDQVLNDNSQTLVNTVSYRDGEVYGFPTTSNTWFMYYNKAIFSEEDVKSLDTMLTKGTVAFPWSIAWYSGTFFLANGGEIFGEDGNDAAAGIQLGENNGGYEAALKMIQLSAEPNLVDDSNGLGYAGFRDGTIGAYFSGSWDYEGLKEALGDDLGAVQLPLVEIDGQQKQMKAFAGSKAVGVNPCSDQKAVALDFAAYLASAEGQALRYLVRGVIPAASVLTDYAPVAANPAAMAEINTISNASVMQPTIPEMANYWTPMGDFGAMVANGEINSSNYREYVDLMMSGFGNTENAEDFEIANVQYPSSGDAGNKITLRIHYARPDGNYADWNVWLWDNGEIPATSLNPPYEFEEINGEMVCTVDIDPGTSEVGYLIRLGDWVDMDIYEDQFIDLSNILSGTLDVYILSGIKGHQVVLNDDVVSGIGPYSLDYKHSKSQLVLGVSGLMDQTPTITLTGKEGNVEITKITQAGRYYYLTLEAPLTAGHYTMTCNTGIDYTVEFDII